MAKDSRPVGDHADPGRHQRPNTKNAASFSQTTLRKDAALTALCPPGQPRHPLRLPVSYVRLSANHTAPSQSDRGHVIHITILRDLLSFSE